MPTETAIYVMRISGTEKSWRIIAYAMLWPAESATAFRRSFSVIARYANAKLISEENINRRGASTGDHLDSSSLRWSTTGSHFTISAL